MVKLLTVYCALESAVKLDSLNALEKCSKWTCADSAVHDVDLELQRLVHFGAEEEHPGLAEGVREGAGFGWVAAPACRHTFL